MEIKPREFPHDLIVREYLNVRGGLTNKEFKQYQNDLKGFEGELKFDSYCDTLPIKSYLILKDLLFKINNSYIQIDSLIITPDNILAAEVKNFEGEHIYDDGKLLTINNYELNSPFQKNDRVRIFLKQILQIIGFKTPFESNIFFVNPEFTLFQVPHSLPIILPTQLTSFFLKLETEKRQVTQFHYDLAYKLLSLHQTKSPFTRIPDYNYQTLKKGLFCKNCHTFFIDVFENNIICKVCNNRESFEEGIMRAVEELDNLFPSGKITVQIVSEWCNLTSSKRKIGYVLGKNMDCKALKRFSYYIPRE